MNEWIWRDNENKLKEKEWLIRSEDKDDYEDKENFTQPEIIQKSLCVGEI